jgi:site-specific recombinase XerD
VYSGTLDEFERAAGTTIEKATRQDIIDYADYISEQAQSTRNRKIATLSSYFTWAQELEFRKDNPTKLIRRKHVDTVKTIKWLTRSEVRNLLRTASRDSRTLALVWMGLHGLRVSEIVGLDADDWREGTLRVLGKGDKVRYVALAQNAQSALLTNLDGRIKGPMFVGQSGDRLKSRRIQEIIADISAEAGKPIYPHALRHTLGTDAIKSGVPTLVVQKFLGHTDPKTTAKYVHLDVSDAKLLVDTTFAYLNEEMFSVIEKVG